MAVTVNHPSSAPAHDSHGSHARAPDVHVVRRVYLPNLEMRQPMAKFIVLSLLLHVWMVLLFGNTGGERANQAKFGSFFARLNPAAAPSSSSTPSAVASSRSAPTKATRSRSDRTPRNEDVAEAKPDSPSPTPAPAPVTQPSPTVTAAAEAPTRVEPVAPVAPIEPIQSLPAVSVSAPVIAVPILAVESPTLPATAPTFVVPLLPSQAANTVEPTKIEPLAVPLLVAPSNLPKSIEPVQTPLLVAPIQTLPAPDPTASREVILQQPKLDLAPVTLPPEKPMLIAPIPTLPTPSATEVESLESRRAPLRTIEPTLRAEPIQLPRAIEPIVPTLPTAPIRAPQSTVQPVEIAPQVFAPVPTPAPAIAIPSSVPLETTTREIGNTLDPAAKTITTPAPSVLTPSPNTLAGGNTNAPASGSSAKPSDSNLPGLFPPPIPALPSTVGTPGQKLDLDSLRSRARQLAGDPNAPRTIVPFPTISAPQTKTDVEKAFDKALKRPDCREAYREMGLAAVLPLIRDSIKNEGCKW